jgi:hypothetical protein
MATPYDQSYAGDMDYGGGASIQPTRPPTWREQLAQLLMGGSQASPERRQFVGGLLGSTGLPGSEQFSAADLTPAAIPLGLNEASVARAAGDRPGELASTLAAVPIVGKEASLGVRAAQRLARGAEEVAPAAERAAVQFGTIAPESAPVNVPARAFGGGAPPQIPQDVHDLYSQGQSQLPLGSRISQRFPTELKGGGWEGKENPLTQNLLINRAVLERDPEKIAQAAEALGQYPNATQAMREMSPAERLMAMQGQMKDNLLALHDMTPPDIRNRAGRWYWGANQIAQDAAQRTGVPLESAAGTFAALSPQMDWYKNVYLGNTVLDALHANPKFSPEMATLGRNMTSVGADKKPRLTFNQDMVSAMQGKSLADMPDSEHKAQFIRLWDEAHGARQYHDVTPEGGFNQLQLTKAGDPAAPGWGSFNEIRKAVDAAESGGNMETISRSMGQKHKVRNFYNNIVAPDTPAALGDITADTHQIAASLMRPLSGKHLEVQQGLGSGKGAPESAVSGLQGLYPLYADATRQAAAERGIPVPSMQSIPWETIRGLYTPQFKKTGQAAANQIWEAHGRGELTLPQAQQALVQAAGGYRPPSWAQ